MTPFRYNSDLTSGSLQTRECRIITGLLLQELDEAAWDKAMYKENVLQKRTQSTVRRISSALRKRLEHLSSDFWAFAFYVRHCLATGGSVMTMNGHCD